MAKPVICAIFLFNYRFEANLEVLDRLYGDRFSRRVYLMPFARSTRRDVIRVQEAGWYFHGHLAQGADRFLDDEVTHYVVISDDLFLNPAINEDNILDVLNLAPDAAWIKSLASADQFRHSFPWAADGAFQMQRATGTPDLWRELPPPDEARRRFEGMGFTFPGTFPRTLAQAKFFGWSLPLMSKAIWLHSVAMLGRPSPYPILMGYADFLVLPAHGIRRFLDLCGLFAAMNLFVEFAIPTALALSYDAIATELDHNQDFRDLSATRRPDARLIGLESANADIFGNSLSWSQRRLMSDFPDDLLYVHPVKFSRWTADNG